MHAPPLLCFFQILLDSNIFPSPHGQLESLSKQSTHVGALKKKNVIIKIISCFSRGFKKYRKELRRKTNHPKYQHAEAAGSIFGMKSSLSLAFLLLIHFKHLSLLTLGSIFTWFNHEKAFFVCFLIFFSFYLWCMGS